MNLFRSTTTLATDPKNRSPFRHALLLIPIVIACFGLLPIANGTPDPATVNGVGNTADGLDALESNSFGRFNTATGLDALNANTTGDYNTAAGASALLRNTTGAANTATGEATLNSNSTGIDNTASGVNALAFNTSGNYNTADGANALFHNTTGTYNTADGVSALYSNTTGSSNVAIGVNAGKSLTTGSGNVCIGVNVLGVAGESNTTRIRNIYSSVATARAVYVNSDNKIGTLASTRRVKENIKPMDKASEAILALRPVSFRYKKQIDASGTPQFGLIAEDVAETNPVLVTRDAQGKPETVRYEAVNAMLLNEFLKEHRRIKEQGCKAEEQNHKIQQQEETIGQLKTEVATLTSTVREQALQIQKVSAELEASKAAPRIIEKVALR